MPLNPKQIKILQTALRAVGLRKPGKAGEAQYRFYLSQFSDSKGRKITSCKQLTNVQLDEILATCVELGWHNTAKATVSRPARISQAMIIGIAELAGDLGWNHGQLSGMVSRMTQGRKTDPSELTTSEGIKVIEALKAMLKRINPAVTANNLSDIQMELSF